MSQAGSFFAVNITFAGSFSLVEGLALAFLLGGLAPAGWMWLGIGSGGGLDMVGYRLQRRVGYGWVQAPAAD